MTRMKAKAAMLAVVIGCAALLAGDAKAQQATFVDPLLDHMVGQWVLEGTIAGQKTTHDVEAEWVLAHQYLRFREVSREKDERGRPAYEAEVYLGWDAKAKEYVCIWIDVWGGASAETIGRATRRGSVFPFVFRDAGGAEAFHTTFLYDEKADAWEWRLDNVEKGAEKPFARVRLTRKK